MLERHELIQGRKRTGEGECFGGKSREEREDEDEKKEKRRQLLNKEASFTAHTSVLL